MDDKVSRLLALAEELARQKNEAGLEQALEILFHLIDHGIDDPEVLITAADYLLQSPQAAEAETQKQVVLLLDRAVQTALEDLRLMEKAIHSYELVLAVFPARLNQVIGLCLKILELDPDHVEAMIILANHREHPGVSLSLEDAIRMLEWAQEVDPGNVLVEFSLARLYSEAGKFDQAHRLFRQVSYRTGFPLALDARRILKSSRTKLPRYRKYGSN